MKMRRKKIQRKKEKKQQQLSERERGSENRRRDSKRDPMCNLVLSQVYLFSLRFICVIKSLDHLQK